MLRVILRKLPSLVVTLLLVSFLTFSLTSLLPGDPALQILGTGQFTQADIEAVRADLDLDDPMPVRFVKWLGGVVTGDFGRSYQTNQPVLDAVLERLPVTLEIGLLAIAMALAVAIPLGVVSAYRAGGYLDRFITGSSFGLLSIPNFMMALLLIVVLAVNLDFFPATGWTDFGDDPVENLRRAFMPALALAIAELAVYTRLLRTDMIATLQDDHVTMARAKGLPTRQILFRHALRPSSFSLMTVVGVQVGAIIGGSIIIEQIFALPGVGRLLFQSINNRDFLMVQGVGLFIAMAFVLVNFTVDVLYSFLDPRIRHGRA